jgi:uncharacterized paraquat-inducible protein A
MRRTNRPKRKVRILPCTECGREVEVAVGADNKVAICAKCTVSSKGGESWETKHQRDR